MNAHNKQILEEIKGLIGRIDEKEWDDHEAGLVIVIIEGAEDEHPQAAKVTASVALGCPGCMLPGALAAGSQAVPALKTAIIGAARMLEVMEDPLTSLVRTIGRAFMRPKSDPKASKN